MDGSYKRFCASSSSVAARAISFVKPIFSDAPKLRTYVPAVLPVTWRRKEDGQAGMGDGVVRAVEVTSCVVVATTESIAVLVVVANKEILEVKVDVIMNVVVVDTVWVVVIVFVDVRSWVIGHVITLVVVS